MHPLRLLSAAEQVAAHLRGELERGRWTGKIPGVNFLAAELGVNRKTADAALRLLEREGLLSGQGAGRRREIAPRGSTVAGRRLRVGLILAEQSDRQLSYMVELQHALVESGHALVIPDQTLSDLGMKVERISRLVARTLADAWVVSAAGREVLEWFAAQPVPAFALFGFHTGVALAGIRPDKPAAYAAATRCLIEQGHQRIVLLGRRMGGVPVPRLSEQAALAEMERHGIRTSDYNLPAWEETREGLQRLLTSLFRVTPPTALIIDEAPFFIATHQFLAGCGLRVPEQVSLICTDPDPAFTWCTPGIAHIRWDSAPVVRRILRWAANISRGQRDLRQTLTPAKFVPGGTIGPAMKA